MSLAEPARDLSVKNDMALALGVKMAEPGQYNVITTVTVTSRAVA